MNIPEYVKNCMTVLENAGYEAYVVGGCVRDTMLGKKPDDWDVTTNAKPHEMSRLFSEASNFKVVETGIKHGTITVFCDGKSVEATTFRIDGTYSNSRHPDSVTFSRNISDDLARRDFTVNAMAYSLKTGVIDLFGGEKDLKNGVLRAVGDAQTRFSEDALRILRAVRFASKLDFTIEASTCNAMHICVPRLKDISSERIKTELFKLICGKGCERVLIDYREIIAAVIEQTRVTFDFPQNSPYHCYDVWTHTVKSVAAAENDVIIRFALLLHDLGKPQCMTVGSDGEMHFKGHGDASAQIAIQICNSLKMSAYEKRTITELVRLHNMKLPTDNVGVRRCVRDMGEAFLRQLLQVQKADTFAHSDKGKLREAQRAKTEQMLDDIISRGECCTVSELAVNGNDLMNIGARAGKELGVLLARLLDDVIDGKCENEKDKLLERAKVYI